MSFPKEHRPGMFAEMLRMRFASANPTRAKFAAQLLEHFQQLPPDERGRKHRATTVNSIRRNIVRWLSGERVPEPGYRPAIADILGEEIPTINTWCTRKDSDELHKTLQSKDDLAYAPGEHLGSYGASLPGAWKFFYVRPLDDEGLPKAEIRCNIGVFGRALPESTALNFLLISRENQWRGRAVRHEPYLYITCTEQRGGDASFIVINAPRRGDDNIFAGIVLASIRPPRSNLPLGALICFGQPIQIETLDEEYAEAIREVVQSGAVSKENEEKLQKVIREISYTVNERDLARFRKDHPKLSAYMDAVEINGEAGAMMQSLRLRWP